jgi:hypothetical protein
MPDTWSPSESLMFTAEDTSRHWPAADRWKADLLTEWDLHILPTGPRIALRKVRPSQ